MELAAGIRFDGNQWTVIAINQDGETTSFPIVDLQNRGLPDGAGFTGRYIDTNMEDWRSVDGHGYMVAFDFKGYAMDEMRHQFFEIQVRRTTFIVPVLALMRALFRPTRTALPEMFLPHALERQCRLTSTAQGISVEVGALWAPKVHAYTYGDWKHRFSWLMAYPSAFEMASSVHLNAIHGQFGMKLPKAELRIGFYGKKVGKMTFVTKVAIKSILPKERPLFEIQASSLPAKSMSQRNHADASGSSNKVACQFSIAQHEDGTVALTDAEWETIEPILRENTRGRHPYRHSQRELLNGVLLKLASGQPWRRSIYTTGTWPNAVKALRGWEIRGVFSKVLTVLNESRTISMTSRQPSK